MGLIAHPCQSFAISRRRDQWGPRVAYYRQEKIVFLWREESPPDFLPAVSGRRPTVRWDPGKVLARPILSI